MRRFRLALTLFASIALIACGDSDAATDTGGGGTDTTGGGTDTTGGGNDTTGGGTDTTGGGTTSSLTAVSSAGVTCTEPTRNANCIGPTIGGDNGFEYPWCGASPGGDSYTCNGCTTGHDVIQGLFRVHGFKDMGNGDPDPATPDPNTDYAELLYIDGNTFYAKIRDAKAPGGPATGEYRGWYFCAERPEHANAHLFWTITEVVQGNAQVGDVFESDVILNQGMDQALIAWYDSVGASTSASLSYCRIGSQLSGATCDDPFTRIQ